MIRTEDGDVLANEHGVADSFVSRALGVMFRRSFPGEALVFEFSREKRVGIHTVFVFFSIDVVFLDENGVVVSKKTLRPWLGYASERAAKVVEMPAGASEGVEEGDRLVID
ncbi:MAG: DUF192 domain-containing protein [Halobacteriales archaeon]|nr:DUF192 domain-containing protein [Halobacteriales archaeon]